jgi:hypothetical protein
LYQEAKKQKEKEAQKKKEEKLKKQQETVVPRGKKNKIKKMKEKYADQDDDEREMRLALLGAKDVKGFDLKKHQEKVKFTDLEQKKLEQAQV